MMDRATPKHVTSSALQYTGSGDLISVLLTAGSDTATAIVYDNTAASGTILAKLSAVANQSVEWSPGVKLPFGTGIYVALTGTSPAADVAFTP